MSFAIWPPVGRTVYDENGVVIPVNGLTIATLTTYYSNLIGSGEALTYDPLNGGGSPSAIYNAGAVQAMLTDVALATLRGEYNGAQARTTGATVVNAGDGDTWNWDAASTATPSADVLAPDVPVAGRWLRDTSSGGGGVLAGDVTGASEANVIVSIGGVALADMDNQEVLVSDGAGGLTRLPLPGDLPVINFATYLDANGGNGTVDDTAALIRFRNALRDPVTGYARGIAYWPLPTNFFKLTSNVTFQNIKGLRSLFAASGGCEFRWYGTAGQPMWTIDGCNDCEFSGITLRNGGADPGTMVRVIERSDPSYFETDRCRFTDWIVRSGGAQCNYCFTFETDSGEHWLNYTDLTGYRIAGLWIRAGARVHANAFRAVGIYAANAFGAKVQGGSFTGIAAAGGGGYSYGTGADLWILENDEPCELSTWNTENSARLLIVGDPASPTDTPTGPPITIFGKRMDGAQNIAADGRFVAIYSGTTVSLSCAQFSAGAGPGTLPPRVYIGTPNPRAIDLGGASWFNSNGLGYTSGKVASGVGTFYLGPLEWPDTWPSPPVVTPNLHQCYEHSVTSYLPTAMPAQIQLRSLQKSSGTMGRNSFLAITFNSVTGDSFSFNWGGIANAGNEADTDYEVAPVIRWISGSVPSGPILCDIRSKAVGGVTIKANQSLTGMTFRCTLSLVRPT